MLKKYNYYLYKMIDGDEEVYKLGFDTTFISMCKEYLKLAKKQNYKKVISFANRTIISEDDKGNTFNCYFKEAK